MTEPLRPMSTGELLDRTFALYRRNFGLFLGIAVVTHVVYLAYALLTVQSSVLHPGKLGGYYLHLGVSWVVAAIVLTISQAATVRAVAAVHLDQSISVWSSYRSLLGRMVSVLGVLGLIFLIAGVITAVLVVILFFIVGIIFMGVGSQQAARSAPLMLSIGFTVIALVFAIFVAVYVRYALAIQACVVENLTAWASLKRSVALSKDGRLRIAAVYVVFAVLSMTATLTMAWIARLAGTSLHSLVGRLALVNVASFFAGSLTAPLATIGISLLYYDERVRKEAFDLQVMLSSLDAGAPPAEIVPAQI
ncbi:MAG TPA: hypothetical protein VMG31_04080 [Verrucomicrobiae bacterium]|nr:hypothetical protein [Verrucomicrobiae bacterium]